MLEKYKKEAKFKIRIFSFKERAGKPKIDNFCLKKAAGKFVIFADSDDAFKKNSFKDYKVIKIINKENSLVREILTNAFMKKNKFMKFECLSLRSSMTAILSYEATGC